MLYTMQARRYLMQQGCTNIQPSDEGITFSHNGYDYVWWSTFYTSFNEGRHRERVIQFNLESIKTILSRGAPIG